MIFSDISSQDLHDVLNTNLFGFLYCAREAINLMKEGGQEGLIINNGRYVIQKIKVISLFLSPKIPNAFFHPLENICG